MAEGTSEAPQLLWRTEWLRESGVLETLTAELGSLADELQVGLWVPLTQLRYPSHAMLCHGCKVRATTAVQ